MSTMNLSLLTDLYVLTMMQGYIVVRQEWSGRMESGAER